MSPLAFLLGIVVFEFVVLWLVFGRSQVSRATQAEDRLKARLRAELTPLDLRDRLEVLEHLAEFCDDWIMKETSDEKPAEAET